MLPWNGGWEYGPGAVAAVAFGALGPAVAIQSARARPETVGRRNGATAPCERPAVAVRRERGGWLVTAGTTVQRRPGEWRSVPTGGDGSEDGVVTGGRSTIGPEPDAVADVEVDT